jgi:hypothetical protein
VTTDNLSVTDGPPQTLLSIDCTEGNPKCPPISLPPDNPGQKGVSNGYADPSMRRDPVTNTLWMAYSYRDIFTASSATTHVVETHLASSVDDGTTWTYTTPLFTTSQVTTEAEGLGPLDLPYYTSHEVTNLYPIQTAGTGPVTWAIVYKYYTVVQGGGPFHLPDGGLDFRDFTASSMLVLAVGAPGASPETLGSAPSVSLGAAGTKNTVDINLSSLTGGGGFDLTTCAQFDEPALMMMPGDHHLYLAAFCLPLSAGGNVNYAGGSYVVFSTLPSSAAPNTWSWTFEGVLAGPSDAPLLGSGSQYWWELDLAKKSDGTLLALVSPGKASGDVGGCEVLEIASLSPPAIGIHTELASITTSDSKQGDACTYEPTSNTGVVIFRFDTSGDSSTLNATRLNP